MLTRLSRALLLTVLMLGVAACTDVVVEPQSTATPQNVFEDPSTYRAFLAKLYAGLVLTGQEAPAGNPDIKGIDEGFSQYTRLYWELQTLSTDEAVIGWGDAGIQELHAQQWTASNQFVEAMYARIYFQVSLTNEFLRQTSEEKLLQRGVSEELRAKIQRFRAEARFLRALSYWHGIDLYGDIPLVTEEDDLGTEPPEQDTREEVFAFIVKELKAIEDDLAPPGLPKYYGRADRGAAWMLLTKLYLNAEVYTGEPMYTQAITYAEKIINSGAYELDDNYWSLFMADNHTSPEIIFAVPQDGENTQTYGNTTFMAHAPVGGAMDPRDYGLDFGWFGVRTTPDFVNLFADADLRGDFFTKGQSKAIDNISVFTDGYTVAKYKNITSEGATGSSLTFPDTDFPMFRLADVYLMYAEAVLRGGSGGSRAQALEYVNRVRTRAFGGDGGTITQAQLTLEFLRKERARELFWEAHRRTDLIRFNYFSDNGIWAWKGGIQEGRTTESYRNLYPIPASELRANPKLEQNPGY